MGKQITDYLLYVRRYILGYSVIALIVMGLLLMAGLFIPGGITQTEMQSVVTSSALSIQPFNPISIIDLPYHLLQRVSIELLGVTPLSIKLPSLLLGALSALGMMLLLRTWFRHNVAIITTILVITTGQFLFIAQSGTPSIAYIFWSIWLLVAAMMVSRQAKYGILWKITLFGVAALSLYTPLSLYILIALASAILLHPHLRYIVRRLSRPRLLIAALCALILLAPLVYAIYKTPSISFTLLGIPTQQPDFWANSIQLVKQYFNFISPGSGTPMLPIYGLGSIVLVALGIIHLFTTKYTARSYVITAWVTLLLPILALNPNFTSATFVPALLLMAMGVYMLLRSWYQLFPRNPYARIAGLVPLAVLIGGMMLAGLNRYTYGYLYDPETANYFSQDLHLINKQLVNKDRGMTALMVSSKEAPFYTAIAKFHKDVAINQMPIETVATIIVSREAHPTLPLGEPSLIITSSDSNDADRFYIYKTDKE